MKVQALLAATAAFAAISGAASAATVIDLGKIDSSGTLSDSMTYTKNLEVKIKFKLDAPYKFLLTETFSGGNFPSTMTEVFAGSAGKYTEKATKYPYKGTFAYSLVTSVPEPATWSLMIVGFGLAGAVARTRPRKQVA